MKTNPGKGGLTTKEFKSIGAEHRFEFGVELGRCQALFSFIEEYTEGFFG
ncbi:MAG: hypothetical protein AB1797_07825 [bacterium]